MMPGQIHFFALQVLWLARRLPWACLWIQASFEQMLLSMGHGVKPLHLRRLHACFFDWQLQSHFRLGARASDHRRTVQCVCGIHLLSIHEKR